MKITLSFLISCLAASCLAGGSVNVTVVGPGSSSGGNATNALIHGSGGQYDAGGNSGITNIGGTSVSSPLILSNAILSKLSVTNQISDINGVKAVDVNNRLLYNKAGTQVTLDASKPNASDFNGFNSADFYQRELFATNGFTVNLNWAVPNLVVLPNITATSISNTTLNASDTGSFGGNSAASAVATNTINSEYSFDQFSYSNYVACYGDSLTYGNYNEYDTNNVIPYTKFLQAGGYTVTNLGSSGQSSGSYIGNTIFTSAAYKNFWPGFAIIKIGVNDHTNNFGTADVSWTNACFTNIAFIVTNLLGSNCQGYLVLSIPNGTNEPNTTAIYSNIWTFNSMLAGYYGPNYFDDTHFLRGKFNPKVPQDLVDVSNDVDPYSLRFLGTVAGTNAFPYVHNNTLGQMVRAQGVANALNVIWSKKIPTSGSVKQNIILANNNNPISYNAFLRGTATVTNLNDNVLNVDDIFPSPPAIEEMPQQMYGNAVQLHGYLNLLGSSNAASMAGLAFQDVGGAVNDYSYVTYTNGVLSFNSTVGTLGTAFAFFDQSSGSGANIMTIFNNNLTAGDTTLILGGRSSGSYQSWGINYGYVSANSPMNSIAFAPWGFVPTIRFFGNGNSFSSGDATNSQFVATNTVDGFQGNGFEIISNSWSLAAITNGMTTSTKLASSNGVPVFVTVSNGVPIVTYFETPAGGIIP